jgi:hypothetical protein
MLGILGLTRFGTTSRGPRVATSAPSAPSATSVTSVTSATPFGSSGEQLLAAESCKLLAAESCNLWRQRLQLVAAEIATSGDRDLQTCSGRKLQTRGGRKLQTCGGGDCNFWRQRVANL